MPYTETPNKIVITRVLRLITFIFIPFTFGLISLFLGKDINWDLRNYHYYNAYAFLENRLDFDIAPAQLQTFINPLADLPFYWLTKHFHPWVAGFIFGYVHGFNLSLVFIIFWKISNLINKWVSILIGICIVTISGVAPGFISELGNTMHDNLTSLFVLFAVFLLINALDMINNSRDSKGWAYLGAGGLIMGMGVGIKPSVTIFAISTALIFIISQTSWTNRLKSLFIYATTGIIGGINSAGFWWLEMWRRFRNPFFPFYNHIFKSPYFTNTPINWSPYLPGHLWEYFIWPIIFTFDSVRTNQFNFFDVRFALMYILFLTWLIAVILRKSRLIQPLPAKNERIFDNESGNFLLLFFLFSYILWLKESATYRFLIPLELLTPLCFLILLERVFSSRKTQVIIAICASVLTISFFRPFNWGRLTWNTPYFEINTASLDLTRDTTVIMLGRSPTSYIIPEFPKNFRFVRPEGNIFTYKDSNDIIRMRDDDNKIFLNMIKDLLEQDRETLYILYNKEEPNLQPMESLIQLGIPPILEDCFIVVSTTPDFLEMCRVSR